MSSNGLESMPTDSGVPYRKPLCLQLSSARAGDAAAKKAAIITKFRMMKVVVDCDRENNATQTTAIAG